MATTTAAGKEAVVEEPKSLEYWAGELCRSIKGFQGAFQARALLKGLAPTPEAQSMHKVLDAVHAMAAQARRTSEGNDKRGA